MEVHLRSCKGDGSGGPEEKKGPASRPRGIICYICGKEYGTASIDIHLKSCKKRWEDEEAQKPKGQRRPLPQPPKDYDAIKAKGSTMKQKDMDALNEEAFQKFNDESRVPCPNCDRKFLPDRLEVHLRSCGKSGSSGKKDGDAKSKTLSPAKPGAGPSPSPSPGSKPPPSPQPKVLSKPKALVCYICGREYGTSSLEIHLKTCKKKWEEQEAQKPPHERKPLPEPPKKLQEAASSPGSESGGKVKGGKGYNIEQYNEEAYKSWTENALEPCPNCSRKFLPDRLVVHLRSCKEKKEDKDEKVDPSVAKTLMPSAKVRTEGAPEHESPKKEKKKPESFAAILKAARAAGPMPKPKEEVAVFAPGGKGGSMGPGMKSGGMRGPKNPAQSKSGFKASYD